MFGIIDYMHSRDWCVHICADTKIIIFLTYIEYGKCFINSNFVLCDIVRSFRGNFSKFFSRKIVFFLLFTNFPDFRKIGKHSFGKIYRIVRPKTWSLKTWLQFMTLKILRNVKECQVKENQCMSRRAKHMDRVFFGVITNLWVWQLFSQT